MREVLLTLAATIGVVNIQRLSRCSDALAWLLPIRPAGTPLSIDVGAVDFWGSSSRLQHRSSCPACFAASGQVIASNFSSTGWGQSYVQLGFGSLKVNATWARTQEEGDTSINSYLLLTTGDATARYSVYTTSGPAWSIKAVRFELMASDRTTRMLVYTVDNPSAVDTSEVATPRGQISAVWDSVLSRAGVSTAELVNEFGGQLADKDVEHWDAFQEMWKKYS